MNPIPWPEGKRCAVAITWDMDADSGLNYYNPERADTLVHSQSFVRYGPRVAIPRIARACARMDMRQTFFVPGWCIERYPEAVDLLIENGHEIALHGYLHERPNEISGEDERYWLSRGIAAYEKHLGQRPRGWRAPSFAFSKHSLGYLLEEGFEYDSSLVGDDIPYLLRHAAGTMIELPAGWTIDDWPQYVHNRDFNFVMPIQSPARAMDVFRAEFDAAWNHGGLWVSVWHPFTSARPARFDAVLGLIEYMEAKGGVWFARLDEICDHVKAVLAAGEWTPQVEDMPAYTSPIPEFTRE